MTVDFRGAIVRPQHKRREDFRGAIVRPQHKRREDWKRTYYHSSAKFMKKIIFFC